MIEQATNVVPLRRRRYLGHRKLIPSTAADGLSPPPAACFRNPTPTVGPGHREARSRSPRAPSAALRVRGRAGRPRPIDRPRSPLESPRRAPPRSRRVRRDRWDHPDERPGTWGHKRARSPALVVPSRSTFSRLIPRASDSNPVGVATVSPPRSWGASAVGARSFSRRTTGPLARASRVRMGGRRSSRGRLKVVGPRPFAGHGRDPALREGAFA